jgi:hypothetical protein
MKSVQLLEVSGVRHRPGGTASRDPYHACIRQTRQQEEGCESRRESADAFGGHHEAYSGFVDLRYQSIESTQGLKDVLSS